MKARITTWLVTCTLVAQGLLGAWLLPHMLPTAQAQSSVADSAWADVSVPPCHGDGAELRTVAMVDDTAAPTCQNCADCPYAQACSPAPGLIAALPPMPLVAQPTAILDYAREATAAFPTPRLKPPIA